MIESVEQEIQRKGLTAPRVTPDQVEATIKEEAYHVFDGTMLTVCCLTLRNDFTVVGESACASPANFDAQIGRRVARDNAKQKIWALEGYLLREKLANPTDTIDVVFDGGPGAVAGRFVEFEDSASRSIHYGEWVERPDGLWALRIPRG